MRHDYWEQPAELHGKTSRTAEPDAPVLHIEGLVASGSLRAMIERWGALSPAERLRHVVLMGGGSLSDTTLEAILARFRQGLDGSGG